MSDHDTSHDAGDNVEPAEVPTDEASEATTEIPAAPAAAPASPSRKRRSLLHSHDGSRSNAQHWLLSVGVLLAGLGLFGIGLSTVFHHRGDRDGWGERGGMKGMRGGPEGGRFMGGGQRGGGPGMGRGGYGGGKMQGNVMPGGMGTDLDPATPLAGTTPATPTTPTTPAPAK